MRDIEDSIKTANSKYGLSIVQAPLYRPEIPPNVMLLETLIIAENPKSGEMETLRFQTPCPLGKLDAQGFGSTLTYVQRYVKQAIYNLAGADDDGNGATAKVERSYEMWVEDIDACQTSEEINAVANMIKNHKNKGLNKALSSKIRDRKKEISATEATDFNPAKPANATLKGSVQKEESQQNENEEF